MDDHGDEYVTNCQRANWTEISKYVSHSSLSLLCLNARSISNKFSEFVAHLNELKGKFTFILITETWLNSSKDKAFELHGYKSISLHRENSRGGGIKIYYRSDLNVQPLENLTAVSGICEYLFVLAKIPGFGNLTIGGIYRPPNSDLDEFDRVMTGILDEVCLGKVIISGDMNVNILEKTNESASYCELFTSYGFNNEISLPTYVSPTTGEETSCLDHLYHNLSCCGDSFVVSPGISDHLPIAFSSNLRIENRPIRSRFRDFSEQNCNSFNNHVEEEFHQYDPPNHNVNDYTTYIETFLKKLQNKYFPIKTRITTEKRMKSPWLTRDISMCIRRKFYWHAELKKGNIDIEFYKNYSSELRKLMNMAEQEYYRSRLENLKKNPKRNWGILNNLLNKKSASTSEEFLIEGDSCSDPELISNAFCQHFIDHPKNLQLNIQVPSREYLNLVPFNDRSMNLFPCSRNEMFNAINNLKKKGSLNDLSPKFLKLCSHLIAPYLCDLFNECINTQIYPDNFKIARVVPIYKKGLRNNIANHRPVSILCNLAKIFESILFKRISDFFEGNGMLSAEQFGFRKKRNTELASFQLINNIMPTFESGLYCITVLLDYSAAFDTISRDILFEKLHRYGIRGVPLDLIRSYFKSRKQYVEYLNVRSNIMEQNIGTVQGSKCAALFFDIYSNDLCHLFQKNDIMVAYADDTTLNFVHDDLNSLVNIVNENLNRMLDWSRFNKLSLNPTKSEFMLITNKQNLLNPMIYINNDIVKQSSCAKFLGIYLDDKLKFNDHITYLESRLRQYRGITYRLRMFLNFKSAKNLYYSCVYSIVTYCICVYGGVLQCSTRGDKLEKLHERIVLNLFYRFFPNSKNIFKDAKILKIKDLHELHCLCYMYRAIYKNSVPTLQNNLDLKTPNHPHLTRSRNKFILPFPRVENIRINYQYQMTNKWNNLPENMKTIPSLSIFKKSITNHIIERYK